MIKKLFAILMIFSIILSLAACGGKKVGGTPSNENKQTSKQSGNDNANDNNDPEQGGSTTKGNSKGGIYTKPGDELTDFMDAFNDAIDPYEGPINHFETDDFSLFNVTMDYVIPQLYISLIGKYDLLAVFGTEEGEYRNATGSVIAFGKEYVRAENGFSPNDKKGDKIVEKGSLDTGTNTLKLDEYVERDGKKVFRTVTEAVLLSDGSFIVQTLQAPHSKENISTKDAGKAYFMVFGNGRLEMIHAEFPYDFDFTYTSISGKAGITVEDMADGYEKIRNLTVEGDMAEAYSY